MAETKQEVFKLQRPLFSTEANPGVLAYNEDRSQEFNVELNPVRLHQVFSRGRAKVFCLCRVVDGCFEIGEEVEDPYW